jgi:hypothetical protein
LSECLSDRKLPGLECALDNGAMRMVLAAHVRRETDDGENAVPQVRHRVLKYAPGKRCVIEYWLYANGNQHHPQRIIGKMYRKNRGQVIFENLRNLWQAACGSRRSGAHFGMPEPVAYLPDIEMVLQAVVPGRQLSAFSENDDLATAIRYVAENLAALHGLAVSAGEKRTLDEHIGRYCHPGPQALMESCPELAPLVKEILNGLAKDESLLRAPISPVHGDLNLAQIFIAEDRAFFIDLDGFCLSYAALDVGNFSVTLKVHFGSRGDELIRIFLESYLLRRPSQMLAGLRTYQALAYLRRALICFRQQAGADWPSQARRLLEAGLEILLKC